MPPVHLELGLYLSLKYQSARATLNLNDLRRQIHQPFLFFGLDLSLGSLDD